jgi:hypothetical protein
MLTEAAQHLRAEKVPNRHQHHPDDGHRDQEAPLLPPKQINTGPAVNMNKCINLSLNSMLTPATTTIEPESSSASPPMSLASGQHVRLNEDIDVAALRAENVTLTASNVRYQAAAAQQEPLDQVGTVAAYGHDTANQTCALSDTQAQATPTTMRQRRSPPSFKSGFKRKK